MARVVAGQYELITEIGRGPTGTVWRARHRATREVFAVKLLGAEFATDPSVVDKFVREQHVLATFVHPALVRVRELVADGRDLALAEELVEGPDLRAVLELDGPLAPDVVARVGAYLAEALAAAHAMGVVHGDVKPTNVLFDGGGAGVGEPRLTDCRVRRLARGHRTGAARFGDPAYAAPEVVDGGPPVPATDVYGLGLVLSEALRGIPPSQVPAPLRGLIDAALAADPQARPQAAELATALRALRRSDLAPVVQLAPAAPPAAAQPRAHRRRPAWLRPFLLSAVIAMVVVLAVAAVAGVRFGHGRGTGRPSAAPSTRVSAARTPPAVPRLSAAARAASAAGGAAFVRYWFDALNYGVATGNTRLLSAASHADCHLCASAVQVIKKGYRDGSHLDGGAYTLRQVTSAFFTLNQPQLTVVYDRGPRAVVAPGGARLASSPGATSVSCAVLLVRVNDHWRMRELLTDTPVA